MKLKVRNAWPWIWMCVWVIWIPTLTHTHSMHHDPHLDPGNTAEVVLTSRRHKDNHPQLSDHLSIEIQGGEEVARALANKYHLHYVCKVFNNPPVYHLHRPHNTTHHHHITRRSTSNLVQLLSTEPEVKWVQQERAFAREKRDGVHGFMKGRYFGRQDEGRGGRRKEIRQTHRNNERMENTKNEDDYSQADDTPNSETKKRLQKRNLQQNRDKIRAYKNNERLENKENEEKNSQTDNIPNSETKKPTPERNLQHTRDIKPREEEKTEMPTLTDNTHTSETKKFPTKTNLQHNRRKIGAYNNKIRIRSEAEEKISTWRNLGSNLDSGTKNGGENRCRNLQGQLNMNEGNLGDSMQSSTSNAKAGMNVFLTRKNLDSETKNGGENRCRNLRGQLNMNEGNFVNSIPASTSDARRNFKSKTKNAEQDYNSDEFPHFNDPLYGDQWYLHNTGQLGHSGYDLNVTSAWRQGFTGQGVTICILDDGFQTTNADLADNYNPSVSYSLIRDGHPEDDPSPRLDPPHYSNSHGTNCAGVVAAVANNGVCGVGVAYDASVGGVRIIDGKVTDIQEAVALKRHIDEVSVFSASWGPPDDGAHVEGPGELAKRALLYGITKGRGGLGTIYVWASGNGGLVYDNCNLDGYASSIYTLTVSALTDQGESAFYSERCASTLASVFVGGQHTLNQARSLNGTGKKVVVPELDGHCSNGFQGSSAAAPLMAGVVALILQANPRLTWRDVQHLVVNEASPTPAALLEDGWRTNGRGKKFHLLQGFGAVNAGKMVEAAQSWKNIGPQRMHKLKLFDDRSELRSGWNNVRGVVRNATLLRGVEHVVTTVTLRHMKRGLVSMYIISPTGTASQVLTQRPYDHSHSGFRSWDFTSVHFWGERPQGEWTVAIHNQSIMSGLLLKVELTLYGY